MDVEIIDRSDLWEDEAFLKVLDMCLAPFDSGKFRVSTWDELKKKR